MATTSQTVKVGASSFTPLDMPNLVIWADASDATSVSKTETNLTGWNDKSGNGNHAVIANIHPNVHNTRTINGLSVMDLWVDSPTGTLYFPFPSGAVGRDITLFIVFASTGVDGQLFDIRNSTNSVPLHDDGAVRGYGARTRNNANNLSNANNLTRLDSTQLYRYYSNDTVFNVTYNSDSSPSTSGTRIAGSTLSGLDRISLGTNGASLGLNRISVAIAEVILCSVSLESSVMANCVTYLKDKWGTP